MVRRSIALVMLAMPLALAGCAQGNLSSGTPLEAPLAPGASAGATGTVTKSGYALSADEQALECKQLTGRMQIRILELRDYNERNRSTMLSRALQTGTATFGGPKAGLDPDGTYATDMARLEAYNQQLAAKGCKTYDLESQLQPQDYRVTPTATIKPAAGAVH